MALQHPSVAAVYVGGIDKGHNPAFWKNGTMCQIADANMLPDGLTYEKMTVDNQGKVYMCLRKISPKNVSPRIDSIFVYSEGGHLEFAFPIQRDDKVVSMARRGTDIYMGIGTWIEVQYFIKNGIYENKKCEGGRLLVEKDENLYRSIDESVRISRGYYENQDVYIWPKSIETWSMRVIDGDVYVTGCVNKKPCYIKNTEKPTFININSKSDDPCWDMAIFDGVKYFLLSRGSSYLPGAKINGNKLVNSNGKDILPRNHNPQKLIGNSGALYVLDEIFDDKYFHNSVIIFNGTEFIEQPLNDCLTPKDFYVIEE